jgi:hypothetical protein
VADLVLGAEKIQMIADKAKMDSKGFEQFT